MLETLAGVARVMISLHNAALVYCAIISPECSPGLGLR
jgi:hypothetical protein